MSGRQKSWQSLKEERERGKSMSPQMTQRSRLAFEPWENRSHFLERALLNEEKGVLYSYTFFKLQGSSVMDYKEGPAFLSSLFLL